MNDEPGDHESGRRATVRAGELPENATLEDVLAAMRTPPAADSQETAMRRRVEHQLLAALGAAMADDHPAVWRQVWAVVDADPVASAPTAIAVDRLCARLLDGVPATQLRPDARLEPAVDLLALHVTPGAALLGGTVQAALPVVGDLLTTAATNPAGAHTITDRLRRDPGLARDVLYLMIVACAQRLAAAVRQGDQARKAHAEGREDPRGA